MLLCIGSTRKYVHTHATSRWLIVNTVQLASRLPILLTLLALCTHTDIPTYLLYLPILSKVMLALLIPKGDECEV